MSWKCGFVGLGQMGAPMARHMLKHGPLTVVSRKPEQAADFAERGALVVSHADGLAGCDVVVFCLPDGKVVEEVLFGTPALADVLQRGAVVVDTSTLEYERTLAIAARLDDRGIIYIDAPVSGMQTRAEAGTLTMMCGGPSAVISKIQPLCACFASAILHMGDTGAGQLAKLVNQLLFDINAAALAEILPVAAKLGLDPGKIGQIINSGTGRSYASEFFIPNILKGEFSKGYPMSAAYKDLISGAELSARNGLSMPVLAAATAVYQDALLAGNGHKDKGGMICHIEQKLGVTFRAQQEGPVND